MKTVNIHEAKTHLSRLLAGVANGESFVIAKSGKPVADLTPTGKKRKRRIGFMKGMGQVPDDFNSMFADEIADMFEGKYDGSGLFEKKT
jgi:prevent-host-death family protein